MAPWKDHPMARKCKHCGSIRPGAQPLRLNGERGFWHIECFEKARADLRNQHVAEPFRSIVSAFTYEQNVAMGWPDWKNV